jgi:hypothetical protein
VVIKILAGGYRYAMQGKPHDTFEVLTVTFASANPHLDTLVIWGVSWGTLSTE